jgi:SAM-dependent methyltransferase
MIKNRDSINLLPIISIDDGIPTVSFDSMPFWEGVQEAPGIRHTLQFLLTATIDSPIRQIISEQIITDVVNAYQLDEYKFITNPPGVSAWANFLGERSVMAVENVIGDDYPKNILEIGGGSTWVARRLCERYTPETYSLVDPSVRDQAEGVEVIRDYFPNPKLADRHFDLVLGFSVLEHVPDPLDFLCNIRKQLTDSGKVILTYPDCEDSLRRGDINTFLHEHLNYFTEMSSRWIASAAGFNVMSLRSKNDLFTLALEVRSEKLVSRSKLDESELLLESAKALLNLLTNTTIKIRKCLEDGQLVAFHGATQGLNSFFFISGLGSHPNIRLYDGDPSKEFHYLPACLTPIMSPMDKSYAENSLLVISAMSFYEQIKKFAVEKAGFNHSQLLPLAGG